MHFVKALLLIVPRSAIYLHSHRLSIHGLARRCRPQCGLLQEIDQHRCRLRCGLLRRMQFVTQPAAPYGMPRQHDGEHPVEHAGHYHPPVRQEDRHQHG